MAQPNPKVTETAESAQMHIVKGVVRQSLGQEKKLRDRSYLTLSFQISGTGYLDLKSGFSPTCDRC